MTTNDLRNALLQAIADNDTNAFEGAIEAFVDEKTKSLRAQSAQGLLKRTLASLNQWTIPLDNQETVCLTPLQYAIHFKNKEIIKRLLAEIPDPVTQINRPIPTILPGHKTYRAGQTAVHMAVLSADPEILTMVLGATQKLSPISSMSNAANDFAGNDATSASNTVKVSPKDIQGKTPLDLANQLNTNKDQIIPMLSARGAQPGETPAVSSSSTASPSKAAVKITKSLHEIVTAIGPKDDFTELDKFLDANGGADVMLTTLVDEENVLHLAVRNRNLKLVDHILGKFWPANKTKLIDAQNKNGETCIHIAASQNDAVLMPVLLGGLTSGYSYSSRVDIQDNNGNYPIHLAARFGNIQVLSQIYNHAEPLTGKNPSIDYINNLDENILHLAARRDNRIFKKVKNFLEKNIIKYIISASNLLHTEKDKAGNLPIHTAVRNGNLTVIGAILENSPEQIDAKVNGNTLIHLAALATENTEALIHFLKNKYSIDINAVNDEGNTALHVACQQNNLDAVVALLELDANINITNHSHYAEALATDETIRTLILQKRNETATTPVTAVTAIQPLQFASLDCTNLNTAINNLNYYISKSGNNGYNSIAEKTNTFLTEIKSTTDPNEILQKVIAYKAQVQPLLDVLPYSAERIFYGAVIGMIWGAVISLAIGLIIFGGAAALTSLFGLELAFEAAALLTAEASLSIGSASIAVPVVSGYVGSAVVGAGVGLYRYRAQSYTNDIADTAAAIKTHSEGISGAVRKRIPSFSLS